MSLKFSEKLPMLSADYYRAAACAAAFDTLRNDSRLWSRALLIDELPRCLPMNDSWSHELGILKLPRLRTAGLSCMNVRYVDWLHR